MIIFSRCLYLASPSLLYVQERDCKNIGLVIGSDSWEYPFFEMFNADLDRSIRIEHVLVENFTNKLKYPLGNFSPCAIISLSSQKKLNLEKTNFGFSYGNDDVNVLEPTPNSSK